MYIIPSVLVLQYLTIIVWFVFFFPPVFLLFPFQVFEISYEISFSWEIPSLPIFCLLILPLKIFCISVSVFDLYHFFLVHCYDFHLSNYIVHQFLYAIYFSILIVYQPYITLIIKFWIWFFQHPCCIILMISLSLHIVFFPFW